ncbi:restriction endonuclease [Tautonia marina]|uniref:restriction endonuclease n=1 Tax=Tautonia marina TaxID=2653855 RepID=UPI001375500B|nr:restriction endonuclease [Tautonia marina]
MATSGLDTTIKAIAEALPYRQKHIFLLRTGYGDGYWYTTEEVARIFKVSPSTVSREYNKARKAVLEELQKRDLADNTPRIDVTEVVEQAKELTPYLISHLKEHAEDLRKIPWQIFEHLVAEFFASWGYEGVQIVGRNSETAADIIALQKVDKLGITLRYFVEVKRWKDNVGVEVIDRVIGAISAERQKYGWHVGMIVTIAEFSEMKKYNKSELSMLGIELKNGGDVRGWLNDYKFNNKGLWLPDPLIKQS